MKLFKQKIIKLQKSYNSVSKQADVVIVGGGCIGSSIAYTISKNTNKKVILIEKEKNLCSQTSSKAAGLVGQVRNSRERVRLAKMSVEEYSKFEIQGKQLGIQRPSWKPVGSLRVAETFERYEEFLKLVKICQEENLQVELISPLKTKILWPQMDFEKAKAILWCPSDGYLQPYDLTMTYVSRSKDLGVQFLTDTQCQNILIENNRVKGIMTNNGVIHCEYLINAAGAHAYHIAKLAGVILPIFPVRHEYVITEPKKSIHSNFPCFRIPDSTIYGRPEVSSILIGGWEPNAESLDPKSFDLYSDTPEIMPDWNVIHTFGKNFSKFYPDFENLGIKHVYSGWPTFTPDGKFIIGETKVKGFIMAGGCNAHGISGSFGIAQHVFESIFEKEKSKYVQSLSPNRFKEYTEFEWEEVRKKSQNIYEKYYCFQ